MANSGNVRMFGIRSAAIACTLLLSLAGCTVTYHFAPIEARVVDAESGAPIEGAVVMANWELVKGSLDGPRYYGQLEVMETVTDKDGRFQFAGFSKSDSSGAELRESDPQVVIFKAGYEFQRFTNEYIDGGAGLRLTKRAAAVNGKTVRLVKHGSDKDRIRQIHTSLVYSRLGFITKIMPHTHEYEKCYWQRVPLMLAETKAQEVQMRKLGIDPPSMYESLLANNEQFASSAKVPCVPPKELFLGGNR
jgi:hypothetical protein